MSDSLVDADRLARYELELRLKEILKVSRFDGTGHNNLETLLGFLGFGMLDGLTFKLDSTYRVVYTTKSLFSSYFKGLNGDLPPDSLAEVFTKAFHTDAFASSFLTTELKTKSSEEAYGMLAGVSQIEGPFVPDYIYIMVLKDEVVYLAERQMNPSLTGFVSCTKVWNEVYSESKGESGIAFREYRECYRNELSKSQQFHSLEKQMLEIANFLAND
ncbi:MAG: hypothetical protein ACKOE6_02020 [Flammeovirgaceae bacterium]